MQLSRRDTITGLLGLIVVNGELVKEAVRTQFFLPCNLLATADLNKASSGTLHNSATRTIDVEVFTEHAGIGFMRSSIVRHLLAGDTVTVYYDDPDDTLMNVVLVEAGTADGPKQT